MAVYMGSDERRCLLRLRLVSQIDLADALGSRHFFWHPDNSHTCCIMVCKDSSVHVKP